LQDQNILIQPQLRGAWLQLFLNCADARIKQVFFKTTMSRRIKQRLAAADWREGKSKCCDKQLLPLKPHNKVPTGLLQAVEFFSDPEFCHRLLVSIRWPYAPICTRCGVDRSNYCSTRRVWTCRACGKQFTVKLGTILEGSRIGLNKWLPVLWLIAQGVRTESFREVAHLLGTTHATIWFMFHRIRLAMRTDTFNRKTATAKSAGGTYAA